MNPQRFLDLSRFRCYLLLLGVAAALQYGPAVHADFIISTSSPTVNAGSTGNTLEVDLQNTGTAPVTIEGFSFKITTSSSGITFTDATNATTATYIFAIDSAAGPPPSSIATTTGPSLLASDFSLLGGDIVAGGTTVGLGHVLFDVAPDTPGGSYTIMFDSSGTSLADPSGVGIPFTTSPGSITVQGTSAVPEPSTLLLAMLASPACAWAVWRRRRVAAV